MKKYELNPKEVIKFELKPNVFDQERKNKRILLLGVISGAVVTWFFYYINQSVTNFYPLVIVMAVITGIALVFYCYGLIKGVLKITDIRYIITNVRVMIVNRDDDVLKETLISKINKTICEKVVGGSYNLTINPKEETDPKKLRNHKGKKPLYTADTMILEAINLKLVKDILVK